MQLWMRKEDRHKLLAFVATLALGTGLAQVTVPLPGGPGVPSGISEEMRKKMQAYRPVFDLTRSVALLNELDQQSGLALTKTQAQKLLPILKDLAARPDLKPADADQILSTIENTVLTDAQLQWMDTTRLQREEQMQQRAPTQGQEQQTQGGGLRLPGGPRSGQNGPGGPRGGLFQAIQQGKPFNPFKEGRAKARLDALIALVSKRIA